MKKSAVSLGQLQATQQRARAALTAALAKHQFQSAEHEKAKAAYERSAVHVREAEQALEQANKAIIDGAQAAVSSV